MIDLTNNKSIMVIKICYIIMVTFI